MTETVQLRVEGPRSGGEKRVLYLDGLRGLAILLVLVYHASLVFSNNSQLLERSSSPITHVLYSWMLGGFVGVDLFFVLSGFLITGILYDTKSSRHFFGTFYVRRVLRIFPLYYFVLVAAILVAPYFIPQLAPPSSSDAWYWLHLSNVLIALQQDWRGNPILQVTWSLAIEEQFYLLWPLIVFRLDRTRLMLVSASMIVLGLGSRVVLAAIGTSEVAIGVLTICRIDGLAIGALLALALRDQSGTDWGRLRRLAPWLAVISAAVVVAHPLLNGARFGASPLYTVLGPTLVAIFFAAVLVMLESGPASRTRRVFEHSTARLFGKYSYALYLFHLPIIMGTWLYLYAPGQPLARLAETTTGELLFFGLAIACPLLAAWLSWHVLEQRFLDLKRFFRYEQRPGEALARHPPSAPDSGLPATDRARPARTDAELPGHAAPAYALTTAGFGAVRPSTEPRLPGSEGPEAEGNDPAPAVSY